MNALINIILIFVLAIPLYDQEDITPPELTCFSFTPDTVDVTDSSAIINITLGAVEVRDT